MHNSLLPWNDAGLLIIMALPHHGVALPSSGLTIGEDAHVVSCGNEAVTIMAK